MVGIQVKKGEKYSLRLFLSLRLTSKGNWFTLKKKNLANGALNLVVLREVGDSHTDLYVTLRTFVFN